MFAALGLGTAAPYILIACLPGLTAFFPRPGRWMLWLRQALAVPLLVTAAWLLWLIAATAGHLGASIMAAALLLGLFGLWWRAGAPSPNAVIAAACAISLICAGLFVALTQANGVADISTRSIQWRPFNELDALVRSGRTVFLDVTADWCVTCKVNKALVINDQEISRRLSSDVVAVRANWTRPDARIAEYLQSFGRYGIPFNIVFGPDAPGAIVLPELLTTHAVLTAFAESKHRAKSIEPE